MNFNRRNLLKGGAAAVASLPFASAAFFGIHRFGSALHDIGAAVVLRTVSASMYTVS